MNLQIENLSKTYGNGVKALDQVSLGIPTGMFGLLGPNGAGKSTLMRTLATLQDPDQGGIEFQGWDTLKNKDKLRQNLGYLPQEFGVYPKISGEDLLDYMATLKGVSDKRKRKNTVDHLLKLTNLTEARKRAVQTYSGGMKQRFGIAQALIGDPKLLIVDEPTAGLDPEERLRFYNILSEVGEDVTVLLSTHIVADVSNLCREFAIINKGKVLVQTTPEKAISQIKGKVFSQRVDKKDLKDIESQAKMVSSQFSTGKIAVRIFATEQAPEGFSPVEPNLEDFYFAHIRGYLQ